MDNEKLKQRQKEIFDDMLDLFCNENCLTPELVPYTFIFHMRYASREYAKMRLELEELTQSCNKCKQ